MKKTIQNKDMGDEMQYYFPGYSNIFIIKVRETFFSVKIIYISINDNYIKINVIDKIQGVHETSLGDNHRIPIEQFSSYYVMTKIRNFLEKNITIK